MPFIGNSVQNQGFAPAVDYYNGDGVTVTFTLSRPVASVAQLTAVIENVIQNPATAFTVSGNQITFTSAPPVGTNNIWVEYTSLITQYNGISQDPSVVGDITASGGYLATGDFGNSYIDGTIVDYVTGTARLTTGPSDDMTFYHGGTASRSEMMTLYHAGGAKVFGNTALTIPVGTTAQRPGTPAVGMHRMNTTTGFAEYWTGSQWASYGNISATSVEYLVIAGGGGSGSRRHSGGGGAGGYRSSVAGESSGGGGSAESPLAVTPGTIYTVIVGAGGTSSTSTDNSNSGASNGSDSVFGSITAVGGGYGSTYGTSAVSGGCGGGSGSTGTTNTAGSGTSGQGYAGGIGAQGVGSGTGGGGGGAGSSGGNASGGNEGTGGNGGAGISSSITGSAVTRAGGGGGGGSSTGTPGTGGSGGGGNGATNSGTPTSGGVNTGGGCGGGGPDGNRNINGGSGVVIIRYASGFKDAVATGTYTRTTAGGYTIYTFTGSGTITF